MPVTKVEVETLSEPQIERVVAIETRTVSPVRIFRMRVSIFAAPTDVSAFLSRDEAEAYSAVELIEQRCSWAGTPSPLHLNYLRHHSSSDGHFFVS